MRTKAVRLVVGIFLAAAVLVGAALAAEGPTVIRTSDGRGADAYVNASKGSTNFGNAPTLVLKQDTAASHRKAWLRFDLAAVKGKGTLSAATLKLTVVPNTTGNVERVFAVYGLNDGQEGENWVEGDGGEDNQPENEITWANAPGNDLKSSRGVLASAAKPLGTFTMANPNYEQNNKADAIAFTSDALVEFLNADTNGVVTLILTQEKPGSNTVITNFAAKEHPKGPAPALEITLGPAKEAPAPAAPAAAGPAPAAAGPEAQ